jgi:hypothetical protein
VLYKFVFLGYNRRNLLWRPTCLNLCSDRLRTSVVRLMDALIMGDEGWAISASVVEVAKMAKSG